MDCGAFAGRRRIRRGRIFIGGDAAHLFTPTGGLGYNTAVEDAVNLGWKLAAVFRGFASEKLLDSYEAERRPLALRNTAYAKGFADSLGNYVPPPEIEDDTPAGEAARQRAGEYYAAHGRAEFNIPGITFGGRYDGSPAIVSDGTHTAAGHRERLRADRLSRRPPAAPVAAPTGARSTICSVSSGRWLRLMVGRRAAVSVRRRTAQDRPCRGRTCPGGGAALYEADRALIRPDQIVAWRGSSDAEADESLAGRSPDRGAPPRRLVC